MMDDVLDKILCGGGAAAVASPKRYAPFIKKELAPHPTTPPLSKPLPELSKPLTVMGVGNLPVIVEDPVRFRKDIQNMVMAQMMTGLPSEVEREEIAKTGSMIEIATVTQLVKAAYGDLDSFKYMMDRVLGKPVNQVKSLSVSVSYEAMLDELDPDEVIEPKHVFCEEV